VTATPFGRLRRAPLLLLGLALCSPGAAAAADGSQPHPDVPGVKKPWDDPALLADPAKREALEFTDLFDRHDAKPPLWLRCFEQHPDWRGHPEKLPPSLLLGDLLFHAPSILGRRAATFGISCASCHPSGSTSPDVNVGTQSDRDGNVDMLSDYFTPLADDGVFNPRNVPSLRGARATGPYGHGGAVGSLPEFVDHVIGFELAAPALRTEWRSALVFYLEQLDFLPNPKLDALGRLTAQASPLAHQGEPLFRQARQELGGLSCASCHVPEALFTDRRSHALHHGLHFAGATETFDTPSLLNLAETAPYFYDGSADTIAQAVAQIDQRHGLALSEDERSQLSAYLEAVGAVPEGRSVPRLVEQVRRPAAYLGLLLTGPMAEDAAVWSAALDTARHLLRGLQRHAPEPLPIALREAIDAFLAFEVDPSHRIPTAANRSAISSLRGKLLHAVPAGPAALTRTAR
jgi:cytochrome c peroxidase